MAQKTTERALAQWAGRTRANLPDRVRELIFLASQDLYSGPLDPEDFEDGVTWPGFTAACQEIRGALEDLPYEVWLDVESGEVLTREPEGWLEDDGDGGQVWQEPCWEDIVHIGHREVLQALVGSELAHHVR